MSLPAWIPVRTLGLVGERKALAALVLGAFTGLFGLLALAMPPAWTNCMVALMACYVISFFALVADWFWARWVAVGLGYSGATMALWVLIQIRYPEPALMVFGISHALVALMLQGERMIQRFDGQPGWRKHFQVDDETAYRIGKTITRTMSSVPSMILFLLAPREDSFHLGWLGVGLVSVGFLLTLRERFLVPFSHRRF